MVKYEISIEEELNQELSDIAQATGNTVDDIIQDFMLLLLRKEKANLIIQQYKNGNIKAREAWKLSGLSYQEFQDQANT